MRRIDFFFLLVRLFLGYIFLSSGLCKLTHGQFGQLIGPPMLIDELKEYGLELFGYILAISQVLVGGLVMSQRFSLVGLIALVPINFSILAVTLSQGWTGTPYVNSALLILNLAALLYEYPSLKILFLSTDPPSVRLPHSIRLFPDLVLPLAFLALLVGSIAMTFISIPATTVLGAAAFVLIFFYLLYKRAYSLWQLLTLVGFLVSVLGITGALYLRGMGLRGEMIFLYSAAIGFLTWLVSLFLEKPLVAIRAPRSSRI